MFFRFALRALAAALPALTFCACGGGGGGGASSPVVPPSATPGPPGKGHPQIQHVVIVVQENRTVDNLFQGFPGADTQPYGFDQSGQKITLMPVGLEAPWDFGHNAASFLKACDGRGSYPGTDCRMDGFDREDWRCGKSGQPPCPNAHPPYSYVPHEETKPYFFLGEQYVFADRMFPSNFDSSSFVSHQYIIAGQADSTVNYPVSGLWGCAGDGVIPTVTQQRTIGKNVRPCFNYATLADELDDAHVSWRYYASPIGRNGGSWSAYQAVEHIFHGVDWKENVASPQTRFFDDVSNGTLPSVSWVTPTCGTSDHAGCDSKNGPSWVASLVNAIGESPYWKSTVMFVFWDDYGGWYDHVPPEAVDYDGLGIRVPLLMVSAYARKGCISHVHYEHGSILKFVEDQWGLPRLSASDARANPIDPRCFDFTHSPRPFGVVPAEHGIDYFKRLPIDLRPPDTE